MTYRQIVLSTLCALAFGGLFNQAHGAQAAATVTEAVTHRTYPLFNKPILSPQLTTSLVSFLVRSKSTLQTASLIGGAICFLIGVYYTTKEIMDDYRHKIWDNLGPLVAGTIVGCALPLATYLALESTTVPTIGISTMIAGE